MAAARASSIRDMLPLVMPCLARKASSVRTSTSNSALPMPRTSYFTSAIHLDPVWRIADLTEIRFLSAWNLARGLSRPGLHGQATVLLRRNDPLLPDRIDGNAGLAAAGLCPRFPDCGAARHRRRGGCVPGRLPARQRGAPA